MGREGLRGKKRGKSGVAKVKGKGEGWTEMAEKGKKRIVEKGC